MSRITSAYHQIDTLYHHFHLALFCSVFPQIKFYQKLKEDAFFIGDLGDIISKYKTWCELLPRIEPFYAVKCNPDPVILQLLAHLGTSFDCASKDEIESVLKLGVSPTRIVYANPCKQKSFIRYAAKHKVKMMTFDNEVELDKIKLLYPDAHLIIRILPPSNFKVQCDLGLKFGCHPNKAIDLLEKAKFLGLNVKGVSFHVGSGAEEVEAFSAAVKEAYNVFQMGLELGHDMTILDVGGGFPGQKTAPICFEEVAMVLNEALDEYFPPESGVRIIAEPGRYFVASAFTLTANVIAKRMVSRDNKNADGCVEQCVGKDDEPAYMYYLNDGVYGSFNCLLFDHSHVAPSLLKTTRNKIEFTSSVWGPTCDSIDLILEDYLLPELHVGEWIYFEDMGAYTMCASSTFNGMPKPKCFFYCQEDQW
ncbi:hypothetical protein LOTGIDRAFT_178433 [Lottia gigantea]|uniref:ornithine decarboxylase n=1 Tax=Lottia gigantea TaxID=225164 RepID=V4AH34_LOTGI|nr:hypothetical protein LOTGIDRAFT_178433 [Lottia gigantea]ESO94475.1 hypothetical protein LOTGIDRAFT_178433 [Lottia gigantea]